jgi:hypothetical protein
MSSLLQVALVRFLLPFTLLLATAAALAALGGAVDEAAASGSSEQSAAVCKPDAAALPFAHPGPR